MFSHKRGFEINHRTVTYALLEHCPTKTKLTAKFTLDLLNVSADKEMIDDDPLLCSRCVYSVIMMMFSAVFLRSAQFVAFSSLVEQVAAN